MNLIHPMIFNHINALLDRQSRVIVAIDGNCAAGKTTLAAALARHYSCTVLHMDDFFLRPEQRTAQRLAQPGGNVDYERFQEEILEPLRKDIPFCYRAYDCGKQELAEPVSVIPERLTIIEGSYSHHPYFGDVYDLRIFLTVSPALQRERIEHRSAFLRQRFLQEWIPMEQLFFDTFRIKEQADLVLESSND